MRLRTTLKTGAAAVAAGLLITGCGASSEEPAGSTSEGPISGLRILVPNSPGSGYDTTARLAAKSMQDAKLTETIEVFNTAGAGGTVGLQRVVNEKGAEDLLMQMGLGVVGAVYTNKSEATLQDTVPIARLIEESEAIVVHKDSPYQTIEELIAAWKANPGEVPVGGASNPGGPDHLTPMLLAKEIGLTPKDVNYVPYDGGGELMTGLLGNKLGFAVTGIGEVRTQAEDGAVRVLAVTTAERVDGVEAPTLIESGVDLEFTNWRGIVAPPGISEEKKQQYVDLITEMQASNEWKQVLKGQGWADAFMAGEEFETFLTEQNDTVAGVLKELGLA